MMILSKTVPEVHIEREFRPAQAGRWIETL